MKTLIAAFVFCACGACLCYLCSVWIGLGNEAARDLSLMVMLSFPPLREALERVRNEQIAAGKSLITSFGNYGVKPTIAILYVSIVGIAMTNIAWTIGALMVAIGQGGPSNMSIPGGVLVFIVAFPVLYFCGRWIGRRCVIRPILVAVICAVVIRVVTTVMDLWFIPETAYETLFHHGKNVDDAFIQLGAGTFLFAIPMVLGALFGRHQRLSNYLVYLLKQITPQGRALLAELAYEEALRLERSTQAG
jgi:hypothetical protein